MGVSDCGCGLSPRVTAAAGLTTGFRRVVLPLALAVVVLCEGRSWLFDGLGRSTRGAVVVVAFVAVADAVLLGVLRDAVALVKRCVGVVAVAREVGEIVLDAGAGLKVEVPGVEREVALAAVADRAAGVDVDVAADDDGAVPLALLLVAPTLAALRFKTAALRLIGPAGRSPSLRAAICVVLARFGIDAGTVAACFFSLSFLTSSSGRMSSLQATSISSAISFSAHFSRLLNPAAALTLTHRLDRNLISSPRASSTLSLMTPGARPSSPRKRMLPTRD